MTKARKRRAPSEETKPNLAWGHRVQALLSKPVIWISGVAVAALTTYASTILTNQLGTARQFFSQKLCEIHQRSYGEDPTRFSLLVSPLRNDDADNSNTQRLLEAFLGEKGFRVIPLCEKVNFDLSKPLDASKDATVHQSLDILTMMKADLLLFGEVLDKDKSIKLWAIDDHGGCDYTPKPILLQNGMLPDSFTPESRSRLEEVLLGNIESACNQTKPIDWDKFAANLKKLRSIIVSGDSDLPDDAILRLTSKYAHAANSLYPHRQSLEYLQEADALEREVSGRVTPTDPFLKYVIAQARCDTLGAIATVTTVPDQQRNALEACETAINLSSSEQVGQNQVSDAFNIESMIYGDQQKWDDAIVSLTKALSMDAEHAYILEQNLGQLYVSKRDYAEAINAFTKSIQTRETTIAFENRAMAYVAQGDLDQAMSDEANAIRIDPGNYIAYNERGVILEREGHIDDALQELDKAVNLAGNVDSRPVHNRAVAWQKKGDNAKALADYNKAIEIEPRSARGYRARANFFQEVGDLASMNQDLEKARQLETMH